MLGVWSVLRLFWGSAGHHKLENVCYRKWRHRKSCDRKWHQSRYWKWRHFPALFLETWGPGRVGSQGTFCTTTIVRKKHGKMTSLPVAWLTLLPVMSFLMTSLQVAHLSQIMMAYTTTTTAAVLRVMMKNPIIFW